MTDNEIGYLVYCWEQKGYNFVPKKYSANCDYTPYLRYYTDETKNRELITHVLKEALC